jgi:hypothetical protein
MYSYHRGREGLEPRDPESGELRLPVPASDTNHNYDAPRLNCTVTIEFPLHDNDPDDEAAIYRETIPWDLSDPTTPSPLMFAHGIANEFGLTYGQMLDLALNIESQIDIYLQQNLSYFPPLATEDPTGIERQSAGASIQTHRYGQVIQYVPGGTRLASKERQRLAQASRSAPKPPPSTTTASTTVKKREPIRMVIDEYDDNIEEKYLEEIQRRSREESKLEIAKKCTNGVVGLLESGENLLCHICHKRCPLVYSFGCGLTSHAYCELHCKVRHLWAIFLELNSTKSLTCSCIPVEVGK